MKLIEVQPFDKYWSCSQCTGTAIFIRSIDQQRCNKCGGAMSRPKETSKKKGE